MNNKMNYQLLMFELQLAVRTLIKLNSNIQEADAVQIADFYEPWQAGKKYGVNQWLKYGKNDRGRAQLYSVTKAVALSTENATPDITTGSYKRIDVAANGTLYWIKPLASEDSYSKGDVVYWGTKNWTSNVDGNISEPGVVAGDWV